MDLEGFGEDMTLFFDVNLDALAETKMAPENGWLED